LEKKKHLQKWNARRKEGVARTPFSLSDADGRIPKGKKRKEHPVWSRRDREWEGRKGKKEAAANEGEKVSNHSIQLYGETVKKEGVHFPTHGGKEEVQGGVL